QTNDTWRNQDVISLRAGTLTQIVLTATAIQNSLSVSWAALGLGRTAIRSEYLYSQTLVDNLKTTYVRFLKTASLARALSLTANEIAYLGTAMNIAGDRSTSIAASSNTVVGPKPGIGIGAARQLITVTGPTAARLSPVTVIPQDGTAVPFPVAGQAFPDIGRGWLNFLSVSGASDPVVGASLRDRLVALLDFARIKRAISPRDERLLAVLQNPTLHDGSPAVRPLTGWPVQSVNALLQRFFGSIQSTTLSSIENLSRVYDAFAIVK